MTTMVMSSTTVNGTGDRAYAYETADSANDGWLRFISKEVYRHPAVEQLFVSRDHEEVDYWVIIPERNIETVRVLVKQQQEIIRLFTAAANSPLQVDFHIVYREGRVATELVPSDANSIQMD